jgi:drug/metabolite transporter (DMT)-like permease
MLVVTPFVWHRAGPGFWRTHNPRMQLLRSALLLAATLCFFAALRYLPLAEGSAITFLAPIFIVVFSQPVLGERPTRARWIASLAGFVGILVLLRPGSSVLHPAVLLLIGTAVFNAFYQLLTRKLPGDSAHTTLFYSALVGAVGLTLALPWGFDGALLTWREGGLLLLLGLFAGIAHWLLITAFLIAPASLLTPFTYLQMIWATLFGYVIFGQLPDGWSAVGMAIIVASGTHVGTPGTPTRAHGAKLPLTAARRGWHCAYATVAFRIRRSRRLPPCRALLGTARPIGLTLRPDGCDC